MDIKIVDSRIWIKENPNIDTPTPPTIIHKNREFVAIANPTIQDEIGHINSNSFLGIMMSDFKKFCKGMGYTYEIIGNSNRAIILFNNEMAQQIIQFTENNLDKKLFVVHCLMGISRSGAVGGWLADRFEIRWEDFKRKNPRVRPNALVKNTLDQYYYNFLDTKFVNEK